MKKTQSATKPILTAYQNISLYIYYISLALIVIGLLFSRSMISVGFISFTANWALEGNYRKKWEIFKKNKTPTIISAIFFIHLIGLIHTSDITYALKDIRIKLPLLLPLAFFSSTFFIKTKISKYYIILFITAVVIVSLNSFINFSLNNKYSTIEDLNKITFFGSNIRLALFTCFSIFSLLYFLFSEKRKPLILFKLLIAIVICWLSFFLYFLNSITGYVIFIILVFYSGIYFFNKYQKKVLLRLYIGFIILISIGLMLFISKETKNFYKSDSINFSELPEKTTNGNKYLHDTLSNKIENGHYINLYVCKKELEHEWNKRSRLPYNGYDRKKNMLSVTLKRYLTSRNLTKDSAGISKLSKEEISYIENGCANYLYTKKYSLNSKLHVALWQLDTYLKTGNATDQSLSQRLEYYKATYYVIKNNFWFGVGSGDLLNESRKQLEKIDSKLNKKFWYLIHNQFIAEFAILGFLGFLIFILAYFIPFFKLRLWKDYLFFIFFIIITISFLTDNTLEIQLGVSFFSFFYCLLIGDYIRKL